MKVRERLSLLIDHPRLGIPFRRWRRSLPDAVRKADLRARTFFLLFQLPSAICLALILGGAKQIGLLESVPLIVAWLSGIALGIMVWPGPLFQLGIASYRSAQKIDDKERIRLRVFGSLCIFFALCALAVIVIFSVLLVYASIHAIFV